MYYLKCCSKHCCCSVWMWVITVKLHAVTVTQLPEESERLELQVKENLMRSSHKTAAAAVAVHFITQAREWKMVQTKCLDNICRDLCWKQAGFIIHKRTTELTAIIIMMMCTVTKTSVRRHLVKYKKQQQMFRRCTHTPLYHHPPLLPLPGWEQRADWLSAPSGLRSEWDWTELRWHLERK